MKFAEALEGAFPGIVMLDENTGVFGTRGRVVKVRVAINAAKYVECKEAIENAALQVADQGQVMINVGYNPTEIFISTSEAEAIAAWERQGNKRAQANGGNKKNDDARFEAMQKTNEEMQKKIDEQKGMLDNIISEQSATLQSARETGALVRGLEVGLGGQSEQIDRLDDLVVNGMAGQMIQSVANMQALADAMKVTGIQVDVPTPVGFQQLIEERGARGLCTPVLQQAKERKKAEVVEAPQGDMLISPGARMSKSAKKRNAKKAKKGLEAAFGESYEPFDPASSSKTP